MEVLSLDQFLALHGVSAPISDFMIDKLKIPHGLTARQEQQFHKEAEAARNAYHNKRDAAIEEYERLVAEGKIRKPTLIEEYLQKAQGHPDNPSVQAARRVLKKRGIDWRTGEPLAESVVKQNLTTDEWIAVLEEKIYQQEQKMDELAKYATPASYDARKAKEYYKEKSERDKLLQQYNEMLDAAAAKRPESKPERRRFINDFGEATTREITTAIYERTQKRQEQAVLRNMGVKFSLKRGYDWKTGKKL